MTVTRFVTRPTSENPFPGWNSRPISSMTYVDLNKGISRFGVTGDADASRYFVIFGYGKDRKTVYHIGQGAAFTEGAVLYTLNSLEEIQSKMTEMGATAFWHFNVGFSF